MEDSIGAQKLVNAGDCGLWSDYVLLITVVGLYGLLNFLVTQRTHGDRGSRMALGADRGRVVMRMVMRHTHGADPDVREHLRWGSRWLYFAGGCCRELPVRRKSRRDPWTMGVTAAGPGDVRTRGCSYSHAESGTREPCGGVAGGVKHTAQSEAKATVTTSAESSCRFRGLRNETSIVGWTGLGGSAWR